MIAEDAQTRARRQRDTELAERRQREAADALDFLYHGDLDDRHSKRCIHAVPCSRDYNPRPYPEAEADPKMYEGTGIGLLYGLSGPRRLLLELAGWNLNGPVERLIGQELHANVTGAA